MGSRGSSRRAAAVGGSFLLVVLALGLPTTVVGDARASSPPLLPVGEGNRFVGSLAAPVLAPGSSGSVTLDLVDPIAAAIVRAEVDLSVYAFNAYPGNATQPPPEPGGVELQNVSGAWGPGASVVIGSPVAPAGSAEVSVPVRAAADAAAGTYAIRVQLTVSANATSYLLRSRGYFPDALWASATFGPNGTSTLNLTRLGVSGVLPETAVLVPPPSPAPVLYGVLAGSIALAALGGYWVWRRGPGSRAGSVGAPGARSAESALGNKRSRDGD